jgi:hypothetical protein
MEGPSLGAAMGRGAVVPKIVDHQTHSHLHQRLVTAIMAIKIATTVISGEIRQPLHKDLGCPPCLKPMERLCSLLQGSD